MTNNATNYVYLDTASSCAPASNTTGLTSTLMPVAGVVTSGGAITTVTDTRAMLNASAGGSFTQLPASVKHTESYAGATFDVKVAACLTAAAGFTCDASGLTGAQTMAANITVPANTELILGAATITRASGKQFLLNSYVHIHGLGRPTIINSANTTNDYSQVFYAASPVAILPSAPRPPAAQGSSSLR
jgi:hypothetical protein